MGKVILIMEIKHFFHDDRIIIEVKPKDREELEKIIKFIDFAELNAENKKIEKEERDK